MFTIALIFVVPLFLYCSYLFAKDIKNSYSMHSFKKNRLRTDNSKSWKPVSLEELKIIKDAVTPSVVTDNLNNTNIESTLQTKNTLSENDEKPVIKLYKDIISEFDVKSETLNKNIHDENLLLKIAREMSLYDVDARDLLVTYQSKIGNYITQLVGVVLVSSDKSTFIYPVEKASETTMFCYRVSESGVSEEYIDIAEIANLNIPHDTYAADLKGLVSEYISMQRGVKVSLKKLQKRVTLKAPENAGNHPVKIAGALH